MNQVTSIVRSDLLIYTVIMNGIIFVYLLLQKYRRYFSTKLFMATLASIIIVTTAEIVSWMSGEVGNISQIPVRYWSNFIYLALLSMPAGFGICYLDYKVFGSVEKCKKWIFIYLIPTYFNIAFAIYNIFNDGFLFRVTPDNRYIRGPGLTIILVAMYILLFAVVLYFYSNKIMITGRVTQAIIIFTLAPVLGALLQMMAYGTTFTMPSYTLAAFLTFLLLEQDEMVKDPLTRLYTRANFESRLRFKLKGEDPFSIMLADLNDFKWINDTYGHLEGDLVLKRVSEILMAGANLEDMVCRYGGDEFFILVEHPNDIGEKIIERLESGLKTYNAGNDRYKVRLSYGYCFVEKPEDISYEDLIHETDKRMYEDKAMRKAQAGRRRTTEASK